MAVLCKNYNTKRYRNILIATTLVEATNAGGVWKITIFDPVSRFISEMV